MPRDIKHKLLTKDVEAMTGTCSTCGPVKLRWRVGGRPGAPRVACCPTPKKEERERNLEKRKEWLYVANQRKHGLTVDQAREFVQGKVCALCGSDQDLGVDHCHDTGKIRGALCRGCNSGLGFFRDNPGLLRAAADYIECHQTSDQEDITGMVTP